MPHYCSCLTKRGTLCRNKIDLSEKFCHLHRDCESLSNSNPFYRAPVRRRKTLSKSRKTKRKVYAASSPTKERNVGLELLKKMGYQEGQGLGAYGQGIRSPIKAVEQTYFTR